ncbi:MAG: hypothetical protein M1814_001198 [Vezdaea aestivalis]|nr:MAG: hypothetical protein M1814_001198 [Vezdaea aestivalis]
MSFSIVLEGLTAVAFIVIFGGGKQRRENSWKILCFLLILVATAECAGMSIVAYLYDHDDRFFQGWQLSTSWIMCTISWSILASSAAIIVVSAWLLPPEGGYELIPDRYD